MSVRVVLDNRVRVSPSLSRLDADLVRELCKAFEHNNPHWDYLRRIGQMAWKEPRRYVNWEQDADGSLSFPRGGLPRIREILQDRGREMLVADRRTEGDPGNALPLLHRCELRSYQERLVQAAVEKQNCILRAPTGSGKTTCAFAIAARIGVPTLVVVSNSGLFRQWVDRAQRELGLAERDLGYIGQGKMRLTGLTIAMQQSLAKFASQPEVANYFGCVICDEVQMFAAPTFFTSIDPLPAKWRIGVSADHTRKDRKEFLIHDIFGSVAADIGRSELIKTGHVMDVEVMVIPTDFDAPWYGLDGDKELDFNRLLDSMADDTRREVLILRKVREEVNAGEQVFVMSHRREHCRSLERMFVENQFKTGFLLGSEENRAEFQQTLDGLKTGQIRVGVGTYKAIGQGIDVPRVGVVVCSTPIAGNRQFFNQVRGRVCRTSEGKQRARMYYLWDRKVYGEKHLQNLVAWNRDVKVYDEGRWVEGRTYLQSMRAA